MAALRAYSSVRLERFPDKEEVSGSSPLRPTGLVRWPGGGLDVKRLLIALVVVGGGFVAYRRYTQSHDDQALWREATDPIG